MRAAHGLGRDAWRKSNGMKCIRFVDLAAQNEEIRADVERAFDEIHRTTAYVGGPQVAAFEREFADYLGVQHVVG